MQITIEAVQPAELAKLVTVSRQTFWDTFAMTNNEADIKSYLDEQLIEPKLCQELANPNSEFYFAKQGTEILGYLKLNIATAQTEADYPQSLEVQRIYVLKKYQQLGIGQQLMAWAVKRAIQLKKSMIWLGVWEYNQQAQRFYTRTGFIRTAEHTFTMGNSQQTDWIMTKTMEDK